MTSDKNKGYLKKNAIIALLAIIAIGLISLIVYNKLNNKKKLIELYNLSYKDFTFLDVADSKKLYSTGVVELQGYAEVVNRQIPDVSDDSYVFFHITSSSSNEFIFFINRMLKTEMNDYYVKEDAIGIGCLHDNIISMVRYADKYTNEDQLILDLSEKDSKKILSSTKDNPIKIVVRKDLDSSLLSQISYCTSLITNVEIVK